MEDTFRVKIDKIFGSLSSSPTASTSSSPTSLWYLADERSREKQGWGPSPYQFDWRRSFPDDLSDDGDEAPSSVPRKPRDYNGEEWLEIKTSIGMDSTLDSEEEEDENDIVALAQQLYGYTDDVNDDDGDDSETESDEREELKQTLKRKGNNQDDDDDDSSKLHKRVRLSSHVREDDDSVMETSFSKVTEYQSGIPDYMRNPSKYTRYAFDECEEVDEESNRRAYMEFLNMLRSKDEPMVVDETPLEFPRSVAFAPKRKPMADGKIENMYKGTSDAIDSIEDSNLSAMEEDETETALCVITRHGRRQYRSKDKEHQEE